MTVEAAARAVARRKSRRCMGAGIKGLGTGIQRGGKRGGEFDEDDLDEADAREGFEVAKGGAGIDGVEHGCEERARDFSKLKIGTVGERDEGGGAQGGGLVQRENQRAERAGGVTRRLVGA